MRPLHAGIAVLALAGTMIAIAHGGRNLVPPRHAGTPASDIGLPRGLSPAGHGPETPTSAFARSPAGADVAPPATGAQLQRVEPRAPLSSLALAHPPKPPPDQDEWQGSLLPRPTALAAGLLQAKGWEVALEGIEIPPPDQQCSYKGKEWACGRHARTAFRAFLRGRSVLCDIPDDARPGKLQARCRIGKQNLAAWLVANGWAKAGPRGPFAEQAKEAETGRKGLFGPPPVSTEDQPQEVWNSR